MVMNNIDTRPPFFPHSKTAQQTRTSRGQALARNTFERAQQLNQSTARDAKVSIGDEIRDFSRIKKAVDTAPPVDNSAKIADLKARIQAGSYEVDYDGLADKMLASEY
jgi:negative regulator of flagellin synthesis FlgM